MKVVIIGVDLATIDSRLPWPDATSLTAASFGDGIKLVKDAAPDMVLLQLDSSSMPPAEALRTLRRLTDVPLFVLDHHKKGIQAFIPTGQGEDKPVMLPPLPRRRRLAVHADSPAKEGA